MIPGNFVSWQIKTLPKEMEKPIKIPKDYDIVGVEDAISEIGIKVDGETGFTFPRILGNTERLKNAVFEIEKVDRKNFKVLKYLGDVESITEVKFTPKVSGKKASVPRIPTIPLKKVKDSSKISSEKVKFTVYSGGKIFRTITRKLLPGNTVKWRGEIYVIRPNPFKGSKIRYIIFAD